VTLGAAPLAGGLALWATRYGRGTRATGRDTRADPDCYTAEVPAGLRRRPETGAA
jgi:hypothetical protein